MYIVLAVVIILGFAAVLMLKPQSIKEKPGADISLYEKTAELFTPAERSFLGVLDQALGQQYRIMGKVRLADVIKVKSILDKSTKQHAFNQITGKHVDFVVCDPATLTVKFVIELDDVSHNKAKRQERDDFINKALQNAGVTIYHFAAKRTYSLQEIQKVLVNQG